MRLYIYFFIFIECWFLLLSNSRSVFHFGASDLAYSSTLVRDSFPHGSIDDRFLACPTITDNRSEDVGNVREVFAFEVASLEAPIVTVNLFEPPETGYHF